jgi:hypothetical protein
MSSPSDDGTGASVRVAGLHLRQVEHVVEDLQQRLRGRVDDAEHVAMLAVGGGDLEQLHHAEDGVHRRADFVAHRGQEGALGAVGRFGGVARLAQAALGIDERRDVHPVAVPHRVGAGAQAARHAAAPHQSAVLADHAELVRPLERAGRDGGAQALEERAPIVLHDGAEHEPRRPHDGFAPDAEQIEHAGAQEVDAHATAARPLELIDGALAVRRHLAQAALGGHHRFLGVLARVDVGVGAGHALGAPVAAAFRDHAVRLDPLPAAVGRTDAVLDEILGALALERREGGRRDPRQIVGMHQRRQRRDRHHDVAPLGPENRAPVFAQEHPAGFHVEVPQRQLRAAEREPEALAHFRQLPLDQLSLRDVAEDAAGDERGAFLDVGADVPFEHHAPAVLAQHRHVEGPYLLAANEPQQQPFDDRGVLGRHHVEQVQVLQVVVGVAEQPLPRRVHLHEAAERVHALQQVGAVVEDGAEARLALACLRFEPAAHDHLAAQFRGAVLHLHRHGDAQSRPR